MDEKILRALPKVQKPARYTGGEHNQTIKDKSKVDLRIALCFPDTYEIGMSNLGLRILYDTANRMDRVWCERVFAPWGDMADELRSSGVPLFALESGDSVRDFDIIAFSLGYEMAYTTALDMLGLAGLPLRSSDRGELTPLVIAGGTCAYNPEPMADFIDLFLVGEGEELNGEVYNALRRAKSDGLSKAEFLKQAAKIPGVYVPSLYAVEYNPDGTLLGITPQVTVPQIVTKRVIASLDDVPFPTEAIVPSTEIVHDRVSLELFRGCIRGCRFCQAGYCYRPARARSADKLIEQGAQSLKSSGYDEITLLSLSTSDYPQLLPLCDGLLEYCEDKNVSLSLPSLRADNFSIDLMNRVQKVRKSGLTFAPEAGSQRLRDIINKNVTEEDLINTCRIAFEGGWNSVKLYFMLGLPGETDEDVLAIAELANHVLYTWRQHAKNKNRGVRITVSTSCFVPKPHTAFQWEAQVSMEEYMRRVTLLRTNMKAKNVSYSWHDAETSFIEAVLSRGDRRIGAVLEHVVRSGGRLDAWGDYFDFERWMNSFAECGIDPEFYANRERSVEEILPWSVISTGVDTRFLIAEREASLQERITPDCAAGCSACGASKLCDTGICPGHKARPQTAPPKYIAAPQSGEKNNEPQLAVVHKHRLLMKKEGPSKYISHLDLMRTMRRAFSRAGIQLRHSEGFNPHPIMSFALPLSVCHESVCELMDFETLTELPENAAELLSNALPDGLHVLEIYAQGAKFGLIRWLETECTLHYSNGVPQDAEERLEKLFASSELIIHKRTKRGEADIDIAPMIHRLSCVKVSDKSLTLRAVIAAQNPTLNPSGLITAISREPELVPNSVDYKRLAVFDEKFEEFR